MYLCLMYQTRKCSKCTSVICSFFSVLLFWLYIFSPRRLRGHFAWNHITVRSTLPGVNSGLCWVIIHNFPGDILTEAGSGGLQLFLCSSCHLSLLCEAEKILLPGDMGLLAAAQRASLKSVSVLQQVINYLMEPVVPLSCANTSPLSVWPSFPFQLELFWGMEHQNFSATVLHSYLGFKVYCRLCSKETGFLSLSTMNAQKKSKFKR